MVTAITVYTCSSYCLFIYTFSPVSDVDVEESIFFNAKLEISDQYLLIGLIFMNTFKKKKQEMIIIFINWICFYSA